MSKRRNTMAGESISGSLEDVYGPCRPQSRYHDLQCQHRIQTFRPEGCGTNCVSQAAGSPILFYAASERPTRNPDASSSGTHISWPSRRLSVTHEELLERRRLEDKISYGGATDSKIFQPVDPDTKPQDPNAARPFICPLCLLSALNTQIILEAGKLGQGSFAYMGVADNNAMCTMAMKEIERRISEGGRVCDEAVKAASAKEQMLEEMAKDIPISPVEPRTGMNEEVTGMLKRPAMSTVFCTPAQEASTRARARATLWNHRGEDKGDAQGRAVRERSRSPELWDDSPRAVRIRDPLPIRARPNDDLDGLTERLGDARVGWEEEDTVTRTVREYLERLGLKMAEDDD
jgi:hypothetical protein